MFDSKRDVSEMPDDEKAELSVREQLTGFSRTIGRKKEPSVPTSRKAKIERDNDSIHDNSLWF